jgi:hypothetical protein
LAAQAPQTSYGIKLFIPFFLLYFLINENFNAFKWIDDKRNSHRPMQNKAKVKTCKIGTVVNDVTTG